MITSDFNEIKSDARKHKVLSAQLNYHQVEERRKKNLPIKSREEKAQQKSVE
jgi:hypothetical protein